MDKEVEDEVGTVVKVINDYNTKVFMDNLIKVENDFTPNFEIEEEVESSPIVVKLNKVIIEDGVADAMTIIIHNEEVVHMDNLDKVN